MPIELQIIRACEFIRLGAHGRFDLPASKAALADLARACNKRRVQKALLDLRAMKVGPTPAFTESDLATLVLTFDKIGFTKTHQLAVLYTSDPHRRARLFAFISRLRGWKVGAFESFEAALKWMAGEELVDLEEAAAERRVPVKTVPPKTSGNGKHPKKEE